MQADDIELIQEFARSGSERAFAVLVSRHINLVYSVALRQLNNTHEAEEVTQVVFIILARKASRLRSGTVLSGWLYQTARLTAANYQRAAWRRQRREQEAFMQSTQESEPDVSWQRLSPVLDEAMARLGTDERNAIVLRFFENRTVREVAAALGVPEAAAQKRVSRATDKLRNFFVRRGLQVSTASLLESIGTHAVQAAPMELAAKIAVAAAIKGVATSGSTLTLLKTTLKFMAWTKIKTTAIGVILIAGAVATTIVIQHQVRSPKRVSGLSDSWSRSSFANEGYQSPFATLKTMLWATSSGDSDAFLECLAPETKARQQKLWQGRSKEALSAEGKQQLNGVTGVRIVDQTIISDDRVLLTVYLEGPGKTEKMPLRKIGDQWKVAR
jgi:RNA polymerase sigma factor (sigma-70 family)